MTAAALLAGCAGGPRVQSTSEVRAQLPALEARVEAAPQDGDALRELGRAYARLEDYARAEDALARAQRVVPGDPGVAYLQGLVAEAQGRPARALDRYGAVGGRGPYGALAAGRRAQLERGLVRAEVDSLLDAETVPPPGDDVVAVFPLQTGGRDARRPLARGLQALLADDLRALGLRVVDPDRVRATLDALALDADDVDAARARRLGRLLGADHVVVGALDAADSLRARVALWDWTGDAPPDSAVAVAPPGDLFQIEADLVAAFAARLGRPPPPGAGRAQRDADAVLLFGRGLLEEDAGRFSEATTLYAEATRLDPGLRVAAERAAATRALAATSGTVPSALAALDGLGPSIASARLVGQRLTRVTERLGVHAAAGDTRDPAAEVPLAPPATPLDLPPGPPTGQQQTP